LKNFNRNGAKNLKKTGVLTPNQISAATGLPLDEIAKL
jgi:hypothetical protein